MTETATPLDEVIGAAHHLFEDAHWSPGYSLLRNELAQQTDPALRARLKLELVAGHSEEDWGRGLTNGEVKRALLDEVDAELDNLADDAIRARALFERGMALHIEFIMGEGDEDRELRSLTEAAELFLSVGDQEGACLSTSMIGIFHHVDKLDRDTAAPILQRAYDMAPTDIPSFGKSEAARHLGQIRQELGDPAGALPMLQESLELRERAGANRLLASALHALGFAKFESGDYDGAVADIARARNIAEMTESHFWLAMIACTEADMRMSRFVAPGLWRRSHP